MKQNKQLKTLALFLILSLTLLTIIVVQSSSPMNKAKKQAIRISQNIADIQKVDNFYWFTREKTYFTLVGEDNKNETKVVFLPQDGGEAVIMNQSNGINDTTAIQEVLDTNETKRIKKISLGMVDDKPVWEVVATGNDNSLIYYLIDFKEGKIVDKLSV